MCVPSQPLVIIIIYQSVWERLVQVFSLALSLSLSLSLSAGSGHSYPWDSGCSLWCQRHPQWQGGESPSPGQPAPNLRDQQCQCWRELGVVSQILPISWGLFSQEMLELPPQDIILASDCFYDTKGSWTTERQREGKECPAYLSHIVFHEKHPDISCHRKRGGNNMLWLEM